MPRALAPLVLILLAAPASGAEPTGVDAAGRLVRCEGRAAPRLHEEAANVSVTRLRTGRAARTAAVNACLATIRALRTREATVGERLDRDPQLAREVKSAVWAIPPDGAPRLFSDGGVALRLAVPLDGSLSRILLGTDAWTGPLPAAPKR